MIRVTISVTQADIGAGGDCGGDCPVWRACSRALPGVPGLWVSAFAIYDRQPGASETAWLPREAVGWIASYDKGHPVQPISFELDVPEGWVTRKPSDLPTGGDPS